MPSFQSLLFLASTAVAASVHQVQVGQGGLKFTPSTITAAKGDVVIFTLNPGHNIATGPFDKPCSPGDGSLFSGDYDAAKKNFVVTINSTDPIYYYCEEEGHCQAGMVGGINLPTGDKDQTAYAAAAKKTSSSSAPDGVTGGQLLDDAQVASLTVSASGSAAPSASSSPPASGTAPASASGASATPSSSPTGAAGKMGVNMGLAAAVGAVAWAL